MRILAWHVHGAWMDAFVRGPHEYLIPTTVGEDGEVSGARREEWSSAVDVDLTGLRDQEFDIVVLQRPEELELLERFGGRRAGRDVPAVFVEHDMPRGDVPSTRHPLADRDELTIVHVTHANRLLWDTGRTATTVIEHGIPDPGARYRGDRATAAVVVNEPARRWRITGTDLLPVFATAAPLEMYGIDSEQVPDALPQLAGRVTVHGDVKAPDLPGRMGRSRVYLHPNRWTSLGLSLLEAMHLGMPVAALATAEHPRAVPPEAGAISSDPWELAREVGRMVDDPHLARARGAVAREVALVRYGLDRFLADWDAVFTATTASHPPRTELGGSVQAALRSGDESKGTPQRTPTEGAAMERGNTKHGPRQDEELAHEAQPIVQGHGSAHAEPFRQSEPLPDDTDDAEVQRAAEGDAGGPA